jgi:heme-degrading monooxygenase HmoA
MHALVVRGTIHDADRTREVLTSKVLPQVSGAPGFEAGYWTWPTEGELNVLALIVFDSEEHARAASGRVSANFSELEDSNDITLDGVEVRVVVASA